MLPPLPDGEAQRVQGWEVYGAKAKHPPRMAPGFLAAQQLGLLPPPAPATPPQRLPGLSAHATLLTGIGLFFGTIVLVILLPDNTPEPLYAAMVTVGGGGAFWMMWRVQAREREEFEAGYTSRTGYPGLWRLGRSGAVLREPDRDVPPPGFYPSPYQPGLLRRWDGPGWHPFTQKWRRRPYNWLRWPERPSPTAYPTIRTIRAPATRRQTPHRGLEGAATYLALTDLLALNAPGTPARRRGRRVRDPPSRKSTNRPPTSTSRPPRP